MSIRDLVRTVTPSPLWEYLRRKKRLLRISDYLKTTYMDGFVILDREIKYGEEGRKARFLDGEQYYSQVYQDYVLDRFIFHGKTGGFFIDIGGNDPIIGNNTYFFENSRSWTGLAFEPIESRRGKWPISLKTECLPFAWGSAEGEADFCEHEASDRSGFAGTVNYEGGVKSHYKVSVRRLADILDERGIKHVDFVSLDVEGAELEVLKGIDFSRVNIYCFTIENFRGHAQEKRIRKFMIEAGYKIKARLWIDEVWVKDR